MAMTALLALACTLAGSGAGSGVGSGAGFQQVDASQAPAPNWTQPTPEDWQESAEADREGQRAPGPGEIAFAFTLNESVRGSSAGVYDTSGRLVRTLWSARPYNAGDHHAIWDGKDDYGNQAAAGSYTIKVLADNVHYDWQGELGVTEDSLAGPHNWDATASFPTSIAFLNGKGYVAGGYTEGKIEAFVFDEKTPLTVSPLNMALVSGGEFDDAATDGKLVYFAANHFCCKASNAVVAFTPDGQPHSFPQGTEIPPIGWIHPYFSNPYLHLALPGDRGVDVAPFDQAKITGIAVERRGNLLASAHGGRGGRPPIASLDTILLWDKNSGAARGKIEHVPNPQKMAFDLTGDLWVIEGGPITDLVWDSGAHLVRIHDVGGRNEISEPIPGLQNPVGVAVNPVNGHLFVADGGTSQQVKEFDPKTGRLISALGTPGGYGQGAACNATLTPTTFWLDFNFRATGTTQPWISVDEGGDLWIGDFVADRILRFHQGKLVGRIETGRWNFYISVPRNNPTRVFAGWNGMLEYQVDYNLPLEPTDPLAPSAKHAWKAVRNWYPCFLQAEAGQQPGRAANMPVAETLENGQTYGLIDYHGGPFGYMNALVTLPETGHIGFVNNRIGPWRAVSLDPHGNYYHPVRSGPPNMVHVTINRYSITGFDPQGFPEWDNGTPIATMTSDLTKGNPIPLCKYCDMMPSDGGIIPIFAGESFDQRVAPGNSSFHLGGLPVNGTALQWQAMPEKPIRYPDGHGSYPAQLSRFPAGNEAHGIQHDIFAGVNGVWLQFSCQFYHYRDDGLLVGQFGWRRSDNNRGMYEGLPDPWRGQALAPGFCGNDFMFKIVQVGKDYYLYTQDEGYRAGVHRWHIWNLASIRELSAKAPLGATVRLKPDP
ncbi:MAG: FlgD immunoglobulin-like domain containing protein [Terracidiphilus sp.]